MFMGWLGQANSSALLKKVALTPSLSTKKTRKKSTKSQVTPAAAVSQFPSPSIDDSTYSRTDTILQTMCSKQDIFNGFGRHTSTDVLHRLRLWPGMPAFELCRDDVMFEAFKSGLCGYVVQYRSKEYQRDCLGEANGEQALSFNYKSDTNYINKYLWVYRKCLIQIPQDEYNSFAKEGLLNPRHVIGKQQTIPLSRAESSTSTQ